VKIIVNLKQPLIIGLLCLLPFTTLHASWAKPTQAQVIESSALIIEAELIDIFSTQFNDRPIDLGLLKISKIHKGNPIQSLVTIQLPVRSDIVKSTDIFYPKSTSGLWLLALNKNGLLTANFPWCFLPIHKAQSILDALDSSH
jgi:hypothetical protein